VQEILIFYFSARTLKLFHIFSAFVISVNDANLYCILLTAQEHILSFHCIY